VGAKLLVVVDTDEEQNKFITMIGDGQRKGDKYFRY
jgi:hypothetical protein